MINELVGHCIEGFVNRGVFTIPGRDRFSPLVTSSVTRDKKVSFEIGPGFRRLCMNMSERNIPLTSVTLLSLVSNRARRLREIVNDLGENWMPVFLQTVFAVPVEFPEAIRGSTDVFFRVKNGNEPLIAFVADGEKSDWFVDAFIYEGEKETSVLAPGAMFVIPLA